ncbi:hypothetical protein [Azospirillum brasilense]|uniref:hypothetical protein n=1 Tax=Azospirillum brasilense TaxID=192 RepID=UPI001EDA8D82|nr:hypothetical protein [Azospirillum brasilense]UKJ74487.1 hypothetical protein H1Q64_18165 [Azospirillum brasilense]
MTKFLRSEDVARVLEHQTILIGSLNFYRKQCEADYIGDSQDGVYRAIIRDNELSYEEKEHLFKIGSERNAVLDHYPEPGEYVPPPIATILNGASIGMKTNAFVFCASIGDPTTIYSSWKHRMSESGMPPYDAALKINNIHALANDIYKLGIIAKGGKRMSSIFFAPKVFEVRYDDSPIIINNPLDELFDYSAKRKIYSWQKEVRIFFELNLPPHDYLSFPEEKMVIILPNIRKHFKLLWKNDNKA